MSGAHFSFILWQKRRHLQMLYFLTCRTCGSQICRSPAQVRAGGDLAQRVCVCPGTCPGMAECRAAGTGPSPAAGMWISTSSNCSIARLLPGMFLASSSAQHFLVVLHGLAQSRAPEWSQESNPGSIQFIGCNGHTCFVLFRQGMLQNDGLSFCGSLCSWSGFLNLNYVV